ncbi:MAG: hypothetical protein A3A33_01095 [Candidatus Yanofskybacteria bacterium RIFCSPLOWO2_01_FULL_49_25]|uniref:Uncharacterized protein n=1 Tax=Candidatus Yanofskybacteria bacterium RIFCSPLOWO2_01_FULL_49_25 TaxID=1802701 RepID=A0A1F8GT82_9BACT|nr:MAG: hypothetical protein A3A33_01095 [Candidatus Yanofskybacteria bacterium RIFCSPLOWO2_01_FULL_49_25]
MNSLRKVYASSIAAILAIITAATFTIIGELSAPFKSWLKLISGHHWETKSIFTIIAYVVVFAITYAMVRDPQPTRVRSTLRWLIVIAVLCTVIVVGYFVFAYGAHE